MCVNHFSSNFKKIRINFWFFTETVALLFPVLRWVGDHTDLPSNSNIFKTVKHFLYKLFLKERSISFLMVCRLIDFTFVVLKLLMFKICGIISILKIEFFHFFGTERVNLNYYLNEQHIIQKQLQVCDTQIANTETKPNKNVVIKLSTAAFQFLIKELLPYFLSKQIRIGIKQSKDALKNVTQVTIKVFHKTSNRQTKHSYTINCYRTTSNILVNGPDINS